MNKAYILIGPAGCGKTTASKKLMSELSGKFNYLSSDAIRAYVNGDEADQSNSFIVWGKIHAFFESCIYFGTCDVIFDATNYNKKSRKDFIEIAKKGGFEVIAVDCFSGLTIEEVKRRNASRSRVVPNEVIEKMCKNFEAPEMSEGFDRILNFGR